MNKLLQAYLTIVATLILLFLAAILALLIFVGIKVSQEVKAIEAKADGLTSQVESFNNNVKDLKSTLNPFN